MSVHAVFAARPLLHHQTKIIVVLKASAPLESEFGQHEVVQMRAPLINFGISVLDSAVLIDEQLRQPFEGNFVGRNARQSVPARRSMIAGCSVTSIRPI